MKQIMNETNLYQHLIGIEETWKASKVELKVEDIEGPAMIKGLIWTTVKLEDNLGIFHKDMLKEINKFLHRKCPKRHG